MKQVRCAIYTRKSSEEGLEQSFNSLDAQRESCAAYILSQASEGWTCVHDIYDDGGISGGTLERPALQRMLADVTAGRIDIIVVYKVDRLTRSLLDFSKLVELFDKAGTSFVSVTQSFNTTTSMGRLSPLAAMPITALDLTKAGVTAGSLSKADVWPEGSRRKSSASLLRPNVPSQVSRLVQIMIGISGHGIGFGPLGENHGIVRMNVLHGAAVPATMDEAGLAPYFHRTPIFVAPEADEVDGGFYGHTISCTGCQPPYMERAAWMRVSYRVCGRNFQGRRMAAWPLFEHKLAQAALRSVSAARRVRVEVFD